MSLAKLASGFVSIALVLMVPGPARSQTCTSDADCGKGFRCQSDALATPSTAPCFVVDGGGCGPTTVAAPTSSCRAAECATDGDCGVDMVCNSFRCTYRWEMPCNADADCGPGFTCQPATKATCTGSAGTPTTGGVPIAIALDAGPAPTCTVVSSYPGRCLAKPITCTSGGDCPAGWTCPTASPGSTTVAAPTAPTTMPAADPMPVDAGAAIPIVATSTCRAPSTSGSYGERGGDDGPETTGTVSLFADGGASKGSNTPPTPTVPPSSGTQNPEQQPAASTNKGGGCRVAGGADSGLASGLGLLALFALVALGRRRLSGSRQ